MAEVVKEFPASVRRAGRYAQFVDGQKWKLKRGDDFDSKDTALRGSLMKEAAKVGRKIRMVVDPNDKNIVYVEARLIEDEDK